jgi:hypothetical protein
VIASVVVNYVFGDWSDQTKDYKTGISRISTKQATIAQNQGDMLEKFDICELLFDRSVVFSVYSVSSTNKIDRHDITEIVLKVVLNTITLPPLHFVLDQQLDFYNGVPGENHRPAASH